MGYGRPAAERAAVERLYDATVTISRVQDVQDGNITKTVPATVAGPLPCGMGSAKRPANQTEAADIVDIGATIYMAPEQEVMPGDILTVSFMGRAHTFEGAGVPVVYATHQEVPVKARKRA